MARANYSEGGRKGKYIESITKVDSVDWVTRAGAGGAALNLSESEQGNQTMNEQVTDTTASSANVVVTAPIIPISETVASTAGITVTSTEPVVVQETQPEPTPAAPVPSAMLPMERVNEILTGSRLPRPAQARMGEKQWVDEPTLIQAIESEIAYIKEITGSGKPFGLGESAAAQPTRMSEADRQAAFDEVDRRFGLKR